MTVSLDIERPQLLWGLNDVFGIQDLECWFSAACTRTLIIPILSQLNKIPRTDTYLFKIHSNIALPFTPRPT